MLGTLRTRSLDWKTFFCHFTYFNMEYNPSPQDIPLNSKKGKNVPTLAHNSWESSSIKKIIASYVWNGESAVRITAAAAVHI